jgi:hypothetical protein
MDKYLSLLLQLAKFNLTHAQVQFDGAAEKVTRIYFFRSTYFTFHASSVVRKLRPKRFHKIGPSARGTLAGSNFPSHRW